MSKKRLIARSDEKHGVVHRDITGAYELEMFKRYGHNWRKRLKQAAAGVKDTAPPEIIDQELPKTKL